MQGTLSEGTARAAQLAPSAVTASAVGGSATRRVVGRVSPTTSGSSNAAQSRGLLNKKKKMHSDQEWEYTSNPAGHREPQRVGYRTVVCVERADVRYTLARDGLLDVLLSADNVLVCCWHAAIVLAFLQALWRAPARGQVRWDGDAAS